MVALEDDTAAEGDTANAVNDEGETREALPEKRSQSVAPEGGTAPHRATDSAEPESNGSLPRPAILAGVVFTLAVGLFAASAEGPWLFDDHLLILGNHNIHDLTRWTHWFTHDLFSVQEAAYDPYRISLRALYWRPLVLASYAWDWHLSGGHPALFHVTNLLLHGSVSVLAFVTLRRWLKADIPALLGALLFAIHPTKTETIAWISGRPDLLVALGILLVATGAAMRLSTRNGRATQRWGVVLEVLGTLVAYLSKEHAIVVPVFVAIETWIAAGRPALPDVRLKKLAVSVVPHLAVVVVYLVGRSYWIASHERGEGVSFQFAHLAILLQSMGDALRLLVWPSDLSLTTALVRLTDTGPEISTLAATLGALFGAGIVAGAALTVRRRPALCVGFLLLGAALAPTAGLAAFNANITMSPRLMYLPLLAVGLLAGECLVAAEPKMGAQARRWTATAFVVVLVALAARSAIRTLDFTSEDRFWTYEYQHNPDGPALDYFTSSDLRLRRPRSALHRAHEAFHHMERTAERNLKGRMIMPTIEAVVVLTPDLDRATLLQTEEFVENLRLGQTGLLTVPRLGLELEIVEGSLESKWLVGSRIRLLMYEGRIASRLGNDQEALEACRAVLEECPHCHQHLAHLVRIAVRARDFAFAEHAISTLSPRASDEGLQAARQLVREARARLALWEQARGAQRAAAAAQYYVFLGAYGRAYERTSDVLTSPETLPPAAALAIAELAFRAGDSSRARSLMARHLPDSEVETRIHDWSLDMQWVDAPREPAM